MEDPVGTCEWYNPQRLFCQFFCEICPSTNAEDEQCLGETGRSATCVPVFVKEKIHPDSLHSILGPQKMAWYDVV